MVAREQKRKCWEDISDVFEIANQCFKINHSYESADFGKSEAWAQHLPLPISVVHTPTESKDFKCQSEHWAEGTGSRPPAPACIHPPLGCTKAHHAPCHVLAPVAKHIFWGVYVQPVVESKLNILGCVN